MNPQLGVTKTRTTIRMDVKHILHLRLWLLLLLIWSSAAICFATQGKTFSVIDFGAKGDGITNDAPAIQQAINACWNDGGGTVLFPANKTYLCGPIELKGKT